MPGSFAGIILFSIVISGMMIFQSASQEKKDKIDEIILSSLTPNELMQGKIIGYFVLGIIQVFVWLGFAIPIVIWKFDLPIFEYLFVPELAILLLIAILGYLLDRKSTLLNSSHVAISYAAFCFNIKIQ